MDIFNAIGWPIAIPNMQRTIHVKENYTKIEMFTFKVYIIYIFDKFVIISSNKSMGFSY